MARRLYDVLDHFGRCLTTKLTHDSAIEWMMMHPGEGCTVHVRTFEARPSLPKPHLPKPRPTAWERVLNAVELDDPTP